MVALVKNRADWPNVDVTVTTGTNTQTAAWVGSDALYAGQPSAGISYPNGAVPGTWVVSVPTASLGPPSDWADDLLLAATYQIALPISG